MYPSNEPFVAIRRNGVVINFPEKSYIHHYPNRRYRRSPEDRSGYKRQMIFTWDNVHYKPVLVKTIFHFV